MMGKTHRVTGICAGAYVAWGVRAALVPGPAHPGAVALAVLGAVVLTWLSARASMWPDLDHHNSSATQHWGPLSRALHKVVEAASIAVFDLTATEKDILEGDFRNHRGLTHFCVTALAVGAVAGVLVWRVTLANPRLVWGIGLGLMLGWAVSRVKVKRKKRGVTRRFARWLLNRKRGRSVFALLVAAAVTAAVLAWVPVPQGLDVDAVAWVLGLGAALSIAAGMVAHDLGDAATLAGVPFWWPLKIGGQRYYAFHIRRRADLSRTSADSSTEQKLRVASWVLTGVAVLGWVPGLWLVFWSVIPWPWVVG